MPISIEALQIECLTKLQFFSSYDRLRTQLLEPTGKGVKGEGFEVQKSGDARVCIIGYVLKSFHLAPV